jgi:heme-degrading monooxygenase HmoA
MPKVEAGNGVVTHINVFTVAPEKQQLLVDSLLETVKAAKTVPGWISASIHRSFDGRHVVNYVQFESHEAAQEVLRHIASTGHLKKNLSLGSVAPGQYEVVHTLDKE